MSNTNTGGPAFPVSHDMALVAGLKNAYGMSLRDYFAAKAMQAYCGGSNWRLEMNAEATAYVAYKIADSMLKARER